MRIGVAGCGYWGSKHVRVLEELDEVAEVVAIDSFAERTAILARSFPRLKCFDSLEKALDADAIDGLVIATPPHTHAGLALTAIEAGKHVLVEKPFTTNSFDAVRLISAAEQASTVLMVGHTFEFNAAVHALRDAIVSFDLGQLYYIDTARLNLGLYQTDVNVFWDLAPHDISIINYLLDSSPVKVHAWAVNNAHADTPDVGYLGLEYASPKVTARIHVSWLDPCKVRRVTVVGSEKMAVYNDLRDEERVRIYDKGVVRGTVDPTQHGVPASYRYGGINSPFIDFQEPLRVQDEHFVDCIRSGQTPLTDGNCGLRVVRVLEAAARSLAEERPVQLDHEIRLPNEVTTGPLPSFAR